MSQNRRTWSRREWLGQSLLGAAAGSTSGWLPALAQDAARDPARRRACILLWMSGGPSQLDTFDPKPGHKNGGPIKAIDTSVPGVQVCEHLPRLARLMEHVAPIRSMRTTEGDHTRATFVMRTGYLPQGPIHYPTMGSLLSKELGSESPEIPNFVSVGALRGISPAAYGPGFLGPKYAPLVVGSNGNFQRQADDAQAFRVKNLERPANVTADQADARLALLDGLEDDFLQSRPGNVADSHRDAYRAALRMMRSEAVKAFDLSDEPAAVREAYGKNYFGQSCLLARRLVERGVPFVEVTLSGVNDGSVSGWDTHQNNFDSVKKLCDVLDPAWATLLTDLKSRGLLDSTLVVWMGEFGRTPVINSNTGRDHYPAAWSTVLSGGGIRGGQVVGKTTDDGMRVDARPVTVSDLMATIVRALGLDPTKQNLSNVGRPIRLADPQAKPIQEVLA